MFVWFFVFLVLVFGFVWYRFFRFFGIDFFGICFWGIILWLFKYLCSPPPCSTSLAMSFMKTNTWLQKCLEM